MTYLFIYKLNIYIVVSFFYFFLAINIIYIQNLDQIKDLQFLHLNIILLYISIYYILLKSIYKNI